MTLTAPVAALEDVPALLGCSQRADRTTDQFVSFNVYACPHCGLVQTDAGFDVETYEIVHSHAVGGVWEEHRRQLADFTREQLGMRLDRLERVLEIGPSVNPVAREIGFTRASVQYVDAMPKAPFDLGSREEYVCGVFPAAALKRPCDLVLASHIAEHAESLAAFVHGVAAHLKDGGLAILSIPDFQEWLERRYWNAITSEHLNYPLSEQVDELCERLGLTAQHHRFRGHSLFMALRHRAGQKPLVHQRVDTRALVIGWVQDINATVARMEAALSRSTQSVVVTGASHLAQYLTMMSPQVGQRAQFVVDNATSKHGQRLYGTDLRVRAFEALSALPEPLVIVPPSPYQQEMAEQVRGLNQHAVVVA